MNMNNPVIEFVRKKDWGRALILFDDHLRGCTENTPREHVISLLLGRSECLVNLGKLDLGVEDCKRVLGLLRGQETVSAVAVEARKRLLFCLINLRQFAAAEAATVDWIVSARGLTEDQDQLLARLTEVQNCLHLLDKGPQTESRPPPSSPPTPSLTGERWRWREPPRGLDHFTLCLQFQQMGVCRYGQLCVEAHSEQEIAEWRCRADLRLSHALGHPTQAAISPRHALVKRLWECGSEDEVLSSCVAGVTLRSSNLSISLNSKNQPHFWSLCFTSRSPLISAVLLDYSNYFHIVRVLVNDGTAETQFEVNKSVDWSLPSQPGACPSSPRIHTSTVIVRFSANIYGTFKQRVVCDFGLKELLVTAITGEVIPANESSHLKNCKKEPMLESVRWTEANSRVVRWKSVAGTDGPEGHEGERQTDLLSAYPTPDPSCQPPLPDASPHPNRHNYRQRMHSLVYLEEMARYNLVAKSNVRCAVALVRDYLLAPNGPHSSSAKYAPEGELFGLVRLGRTLSEETPEGRLLLNCISALVLPTPAVNKELNIPDIRTVYEALIEDKTKGGVYLRFSSETVSAFNLKANTFVTMEVQFQENRVPFCEWHLAIDKITDLRILFPDVSDKPSIPWSPSRHWSELIDPKLNVKQKEAILAITAPSEIHLPPVLLIGPFGTGKTYTLAQSVKTILREPLTRVLICTHSNSAADLYIKEYLHPYVEAGHEEARPLRIYYHRRWVSTVNPTLIQYTLMETNEHGVRYFRLPSLEDVIKHRVIVVTLSMTMYLTSLGLPKGHFTHMLLDEAAQTIETEAIMPLALANENTRIVLAGDPMQLSPDVYSSDAKRYNLHISLLERLYDYYPPDFPCKICLCENYRAHPVIVKFTSEVFYEEKLLSSSKQPSHKKFFPLTFFTCQGSDVTDSNSTAFYNIAEVCEVADRVCELVRDWPAAWGSFDDSSIGVMTPYPDQVVRIRNELRKRRLANVSVERVLNVQGKQFRAVILSTVRTRATCRDDQPALDYGFLSSPRLLNTAVTRAQSLLAVVGDPVTLCTVGRCRKVWEKFIRLCEKGGSLFGTTWANLQLHLDSLEMKKLYGLNPLAPEFVPRFGSGVAGAAPAAQPVMVVAPPAVMPVYYGTAVLCPPPQLLPPQPHLPLPPPNPIPIRCDAGPRVGVSPREVAAPPIRPLPPSLLPPNVTMEQLVASVDKLNLWHSYLLANFGPIVAGRFAELAAEEKRRVKECHQMMTDEVLGVNSIPDLFTDKLHLDKDSEPYNGSSPLMEECEEFICREGSGDVLGGVSETRAAAGPTLRLYERQSARTLSPPPPPTPPSYASIDMQEIAGELFKKECVTICEGFNECVTTISEEDNECVIREEVSVSVTYVERWVRAADLCFGENQ